jgi:1-acyl-sn-glycerol-3-phosphate acyltransferase
MSGSLTLSLRAAQETLAISVPTVVDEALGRVTKPRCDARLDAWSRALVGHARIRLEVSGHERVKPGVAYVVVSNHQSLYDVPVLFRVFGPDIRMVAKRELFEIPIFGGAMRAAGFIPVHRGDARSSVHTFGSARGLLERGTLVWIAPEGTRSRSGALLPFKPGAFRLAIESQAAVLPVTLDGTRHVLPPTSWRPRPGATVHVTIHAPVQPPARGGGPAARRLLAERVCAVIESGLRARRRAPLSGHEPHQSGRNP